MDPVHSQQMNFPPDLTEIAEIRGRRRLDREVLQQVVDEQRQVTHVAVVVRTWSFPAQATAARNS